MKRFLSIVLVVAFAITPAIAASKKESKQQTLADIGDCLSPENEAAKESWSVGDYGKACGRAGISESEALKRHEKTQELRAKIPGVKIAAGIKGKIGTAFEDAKDLKEFLGGYLGVPSNTSWNTHCINGTCKHTITTGFVINNGTRGDARYNIRVENSAISLDRDLLILAGKRGVKLSDKLLLPRLLTRLEFLHESDCSSAPGASLFRDACKQYASGFEANDFIGGIGYYEVLLATGLHDAPNMTLTLIQKVMALNNNLFQPDYHYRNCKPEAKEAGQ